MRIVLIIVSVLFLSKCTKLDEAKDQFMPSASTEELLSIDLNNLPSYQTALPIHYDSQVVGATNQTVSNPITDEGATLGRVLFYDKNLSINNTISCASCHIQSTGFSDTEALSLGFDGSSRTGAHSMRLGNIQFYSDGRMFWDKRAASVEDQTTEPIINDVEMGFDEAHGGLDAAIEKISELDYYDELFTMVFGDNQITEERMQNALAQFLRSMVSVNSKFDEGYAQTYNLNTPDRGLRQDFSNYSDLENRGKRLFVDPPNAGGLGCVSCHQAPTFALDSNSRSNGLDAGETTVFKSPSLKNVAVDGAYMHDGRFTSLEQVINFYRNGIQGGPALDNRLKTPNGQPLRMNISNDDANALIAFMETLTDNTLRTDERFSNPFNE